MHCNSRPLDVAANVRRFNYDADNAPAYKFNNSTKGVSAIDEHISVFWL